MANELADLSSSRRAIFEEEDYGRRAHRPQYRGPANVPRAFTQPPIIQHGMAQVYAHQTGRWNAFQGSNQTPDRDSEHLGDIAGGQLHRINRGEHVRPPIAITPRQPRHALPREPTSHPSTATIRPVADKPQNIARPAQESSPAQVAVVKPQTQANTPEQVLAAPPTNQETIPAVPLPKVAFMLVDSLKQRGIPEKPTLTLVKSVALGLNYGWDHSTVSAYLVFIHAKEDGARMMEEVFPKELDRFEKSRTGWESYIASNPHILSHSAVVNIATHTACEDTEAVEKQCDEFEAGKSVMAEVTQDTKQSIERHDGAVKSAVDEHKWITGEDPASFFIQGAGYATVIQKLPDFGDILHGGLRNSKHAVSSVRRDPVRSAEETGFQEILEKTPEPWMKKASTPRGLLASRYAH